MLAAAAAFLGLARCAGGDQTDSAGPVGTTAGSSGAPDGSAGGDAGPAGVAGAAGWHDAAGGAGAAGSAGNGGAGGADGAGGGAMEPPDGPITGIWYSTWYAKHGRYVWITGHGIGSTHQMLADVTGDGKADAIAFFGSGSLAGGWFVSASNGDGFDNYSQWASGHGVGSSAQMLADVTGDGKADAIAFFGSGPLAGNWYVAASSGSSFPGSSQWASGHGAGSSAQMLADVTGDGKADAVAFFGSGPLAGNWYVAASSGSSFPGYSQWASGHGVGSSSQMLADVTGDGKADAVVFFGSGPLAGSWYVAPSNAAGFDLYSQWASGHGAGSSSQMLADGDGDGKADAIAYASDGTWTAAWSSGAGFGPPVQWAVAHGAGSSRQLAADVYGAGDKSAAAVAYGASDGSWRVLRASQYFKPNVQNTWEAWGIRYVPLALGKAQTYDSADPAVLDEHLGMLGAARIDFVLLDETNCLDVDAGYIKARARALCERVAKRRAAGDLSTPRYAIAIGCIQYGHDPQQLEGEAKQVLDELVTAAACGGPASYFKIGGKPLLVVYAEWKDRQAWEAWHAASCSGGCASDAFVVRWIQGYVEPPTPSPCMPTPGPGNQPPQSLWGQYYGWGMPAGALDNDDVMVAMPGWNNHKGTYVSRSCAASGGTPGSFYQNWGWNRILTRKPLIAVVNSFNEYAEETAVAPAETGALVAPSEGWPSADFYWKATVSFNAQRKP